MSNTRKENHSGDSGLKKDGEAEHLMEYGNLLRKTLLEYRHLLGGRGDILVHILTRNNDLTLIRILFTHGEGRVRHSHEDEEWNACMNWVRGVSSYRNQEVKEGRILISGDLCVILHQELTQDHAHQDAEAIIEALVTWHGKGDTGKTRLN